MGLTTHFLAAFFDLNLHDGNESGDSEEDRSSPPTSLDDFNIAIQLAPDNLDLMNLIQDLRRRGLTQQIPDDKCAKFNATPQGPKFTCRLFRNNGQRCSKSFARHDRFKHHLQGHIRITPFCCMDFGGFTAEPKWYIMSLFTYDLSSNHNSSLELFSSIAARDTHARNKGESPTRKW